MRFRFRTLLVAIASIAILLAIVTPCYRRYQALRLLNDRGGVFYFEGNFSGYCDEPTPTNFLSTVHTLGTSKELHDRELQGILHCLAEVQRISFHSAAMSRETALSIGQLSSLEEFGTGPDVQLGAEELDCICRSSSLRTIALLVPLEQKHFEILGRNKALTKIYVHFTFVTEANLRDLIERPRLEVVSFSFRGSVPRDAIEALLKRHPQVTMMCHSSDPEGEAWWDELSERFPEAQIIR